MPSAFGGGKMLNSLAWMNKYYVLDLRPGNSYVQWLVDQGHTVFIVSWINPGKKLSDKSFEDYMVEGLLAAADLVLASYFGLYAFLFMLLSLVAGIGYEDDIPKAEGILSEILSAHEKVLKDPAPVIKVANLGESSVDFIVRPWSKTDDYWDIYWDVTRAVKMRFDEEGISIPFPQRDVHVYEEQLTKRPAE